MKEVYSNITVVLPGIKTPFRASKVFVNVESADLASFYNDDYALIYLPTMKLPTTTPAKSKSFFKKSLTFFKYKCFSDAVASINTPATDDVSADPLYAPNLLFKICGFGATQVSYKFKNLFNVFYNISLNYLKNSPNYPNSKLKCANVTIVPLAKCDGTANPAIMVPTAGVFCIAPNNDGNTCAGDYGGKKNL